MQADAAERLEALAVWATVAVGVVLAVAALILIGGVAAGAVPAPALLAVVPTGFLVQGSHRTWRAWRRRAPRPSRSRGLLDGVGERVDPFVRWGALGIGAMAALVAIAVVVLGLVGGEPLLVPLAVIPAGVGVGGYLRWSAGTRDKERRWTTRAW